MTMKGRQFESVQDSEASTIRQLKMQKRELSDLLQKVAKNRISMFEAMESIFKRINGNTSVVVIFKHFILFFSHILYSDLQMVPI